jgi:hypothetical protein
MTVWRLMGNDSLRLCSVFPLNRLFWTSEQRLEVNRFFFLIGFLRELTQLEKVSSGSVMNVSCKPGDFRPVKIN